MKRQLIISFSFLLSILVFLITCCTNSLLDDIVQDVESATTISAPVLAGSLLTNDQTPTWTWTPVPDAEYYRYGFAENDWITTSTEELTFTPSANLNEGTYTLYLQAGKEPDVWSESATLTIVVDLTSPGAPVVTGTTPTADTTPVWSWNEDEDVQLYRYGFSEDSWISQDALAPSFTPASGLSEGAYTLYVQARDEAGNWSTSGSFLITIDLSAPDLTGLASNTTPAQSVTWTWDCADADAQYRFIVNDVEDPVSDWMGADWGTTKTYTLDGVTGTYFLHIQVKDSLGNISAEAVYSVVLDNTLPATPVPNGTALTNDQTPAWTWGPVSEADFYRYGFAEEEWISSSTDELTYTPSVNLSEGTYTLYVQAGKNPDLWSGSGSFTTEIDLTSPDRPVVTGTTPTNDTTPKWSWTADTDALLYRYGFSEGTWITQTGDTESYTPISALTESGHTLYVQARDGAGNWSDSGSFLITIDLTTPELTGLSSSSTPARSIAWTWDCADAEAEYRFIINDVEDPVSDWTSASWGTTETYTLSSGTGTFYLHIQVKDSLGNISAEAVYSAVLDNTPPEAPTVVGDASTGFSNPVWGWDVPTDTAFFRYQLNGETSDGWTSVAAAVTSYQVAVEDYLDEGSYTLYVQASDTLGNWSASGSYATTVLIAPPSSSSPADGSSLLTLTPLLEWAVVDYAQAYQIQINEASDFTGTMIADDATLTAEEYKTTDGIVPGGTYYWRVRVKNNGDFWGDTWSTVIDFSIPETWAMTLGGSSYESANFVAATSDGGMIVTGYNYSYESNGDLWIVKLNGIGEVEWEKALGTTSTDNGDYGYTILETSDNGFIVAGNGEFSNDFYIHPWILKLDSSGTIEIEKTYDNGYDEEIYSIQQTADDGYIACGFTEGYDGCDAWVFKLDSSLDVVWENSYGGDGVSGYDYTRSVRQTGDGGYIVAGQTYSFKAGSDYEAWIMKLTSAGAVSWGTCYGRTDSGYDDIFFDVKQTSDNGYIAAGFSKLGTYDWDYLTLKLDSSGSLEWINNIGFYDYKEQAYSILETSLGDFVLAGLKEVQASPWDIEAWMVQLDSLGSSMSWQKSYGGSSADDLFNTIDITSTGGILGAGYTYSYGAGQNDAWLIQTDDTGDCGDLDVDTSATIRTSGDDTDIGDFTATVTSVTVTATSAAVIDTADDSLETTTSATAAYQVP